MNKKRNNFLLSVGLVSCGILVFLITLFSHPELFSTRFDPEKAEKMYGQSQWQQSQNIAPDKALDEWAIKNKYTGWDNFVSDNEKKIDVKKVRDRILGDISDKAISDSFLYSYAGYKYINGENPSLLNPEHPPFAKYIIGYSIKSFGNQHIGGVLIAFLTLLLVALVSYQISGSLLLASLSFFLSSLFPLFTDQIVNGPQLELYQLFFFLLTTSALLKARVGGKFIYVLLTGISFGLLLSSKTFLPFFVLFSSWIVLVFWREWKKIALIIGIGLVVFVLTYFRFFALGGTLRSFLGLQKYIVVFYGNSSIPYLEFAGNYLRLIFTGTWKFWDSARSVSHYSQWNLLWPILFLLGVWRIKGLWKSNPKSRPLIIFLILYNLFVFITPIFPRYLLLLYIPITILL